MKTVTFRGSENKKKVKIYVKYDLNIIFITIISLPGVFVFVICRSGY